MQVTYQDSSVVTVTHRVAPNATARVIQTTPNVVTLDHGIQGQFDAMLDKAHHVLNHFRQNKPGSVWGCDGVGYVAQKNQGLVQVHKSGVGSKKWHQGCAMLLICPDCQDVDVEIAE